MDRGCGGREGWVVETAAESFKKRAGSATVAGLMRFLKNAPRFLRSRGTKSAEQDGRGVKCAGGSPSARPKKSLLPGSVAGKTKKPGFCAACEVVPCPPQASLGVRRLDAAFTCVASGAFSVADAGATSGRTACQLRSGGKTGCRAPRGYRIRWKNQRRRQASAVQGGLRPQM